VNDEPNTTNGTAVPVHAGELAPMPATVIAAVPITLEGGEEFFELQLRAPGIIRGAGFFMHTPKVIASAMRGVQPVPMPLLLVEVKTDGELQRRRFFFVPSDKPMVAKPGFELQWRATAIMPSGAGHLFEVVEASS